MVDIMEDLGTGEVGGGIWGGYYWDTLYICLSFQRICKINEKV